MEGPKHTHTTFSVSTGTIIKIAAVILAIFALFYLRDILLLILTAVVIASAIEPGTLWFVRHGMPRVLGVIIIYVILVVVFGGVVYLLLPTFLEDLSSFFQTLPSYITTLDVNTRESGFGSAVEELSKGKSVGETVQNLTTTFSAASGGILATITSIFGGISSFLIVLVLAFYLSVQERGVEEFLRMVTPLKHEKYVLSLWRRTQGKIGKWIQGQLLLALFVGVLVFIALSLLGVRNALFLALIATVFEIIPVFGPIIAAIPALLVGFLQGGVGFTLLIALVYAVIQQIESNVIYPLVVRKVVNVQPLVVIIGLIVGAKLGGFLGILLSVPVATALTEFMNDVMERRSAARELTASLNE